MFKSSACYYQNRIYIGSTDNYLRCVNARTGHVIWAANMGADCDSSPCVYKDKLYVCGESGHARCLNPRTGKLIWETNLGGTGRGTPPGSNGVESSPALRDGELYASTYDGNLFCLGARRGKIRWQARTNDDTDASAVVTEDFVYTAAEDRASKVYCFDRHSRDRLRWTFDANTKGYWSTPAYADKTVYVGGQDGRMYAIDGDTGRGQWAFEAKAPIWSSPAWVDGRVIFGSYDEHIYILDGRSGRLLNTIKLDGRCISTPAVVNGKIYVGTATGNFYCIG
jgi:outer membrane protein assembly factor BamB